MIRSSCRLLDQTGAPHKQYKYSYIPDPRKMAPIEKTARLELAPQVIRPPNAFTPNHEVFLEKCDIHRLKPTAEFKGAFKDWQDLMTCSYHTMRHRGIPQNTRIAIVRARRAFLNGKPPEHHDTKQEYAFYKQFKTQDFSHRVIPELPEKYRPHQSGVDQAPIPDYKAINNMPEWALKEVDRLNQKIRK
jgi:hypothetical protein